ncbi:MAG TPA: nicotinate-nucleotide adenylyltransferase [Bacteroidota bacterium]|nr:nicotinate-nucleotide adenylyltransferase [Bacteroidota bacterium]
MRIGIFGGTFDPPHMGHLIPVEAAREILRLDHVKIIPAALSPHKMDRDLSSPETRLAMVRLAFGENDAFVIDERELRRKPPSYMVDTLEDLRRQYPEDELFLLLGTDNLYDFEMWKSPKRILELAKVVALARPDWNIGLPTNALTREIERLDTPLVEISSSAIRKLVMAGRSIRYLVPGPVEEYIRRNGMYR